MPGIVRDGEDEEPGVVGTTTTASGGTADDYRSFRDGARRKRRLQHTSTSSVVPAFMQPDHGDSTALSPPSRHSLSCYNYKLPVGEKIPRVHVCVGVPPHVEPEEQPREEFCAHSDASLTVDGDTTDRRARQHSHSDSLAPCIEPRAKCFDDDTNFSAHLTEENFAGSNEVSLELPRSIRIVKDLLPHPLAPARVATLEKGSFQGEIVGRTLRSVVPRPRQRAWSTNQEMPAATSMNEAVQVVERGTSLASEVADTAELANGFVAWEALLPLPVQCLEESLKLFHQEVNDALLQHRLRPECRGDLELMASLLEDVMDLQGKIAARRAEIPLVSGDSLPSSSPLPTSTQLASKMVTQYYVNHPSDRHGDSLSSSDEQDPQDYRIPSPAISDSAEEETSHLPPFILDINTIHDCSCEAGYSDSLSSSDLEAILDISHRRLFHNLPIVLADEMILNGLNGCDKLSLDVAAHLFSVINEERMCTYNLFSVVMELASILSEEHDRHARLLADLYQEHRLKVVGMENRMSSHITHLLHVVEKQSVDIQSLCNDSLRQPCGSSRGPSPFRVTQNLSGSRSTCGLGISLSMPDLSDDSDHSVYFSAATSIARSSSETALEPPHNISTSSSVTSLISSTTTDTATVAASAVQQPASTSWFSGLLSWWK